MGTEVPDLRVGTMIVDRPEDSEWTRTSQVDPTRPEDESGFGSRRDLTMDNNGERNPRGDLSRRQLKGRGRVVPRKTPYTVEKVRLEG